MEVDADNDEYPNDEEVAAFYGTQSESRRTRTNPQSQAEAPKAKENPSSNKFSCSKCKFKTTNESMLKKHVTTNHVNLSPFGCDICEFTAATEVNLERHKESLHRNQSTKSKNKATGHEYSCSECNFKSMNENMLKEHVSSEHVIINPFACDVCDFSTTSGINLNWHKQAMHSHQNNNFKE